jgi:hypothetical protein
LAQIQAVSLSGSARVAGQEARESETYRVDENIDGDNLDSGHGQLPSVREGHDPPAQHRVYGQALMPRRRPTPADHDDVVRLVLGAIPDDWQAVLVDLAGLHPPHDTFPGEVLFELAVNALDLSGATRAEPIDYDGLREQNLPEISFTGKTAQRKSRYVVHGVAAQRGVLQPDLLDDVAWWRNDDFWVWADYALIIYVRAAADRTRRSTADICTQLAGDPNTRP